jgi:uncharacterized damage-inducible protein DinB
MHGYDSKDLARSFQTVRANTIKIAEEIPEDKYGFRPAEGSRSVAETLAHLAVATDFPLQIHTERITAADFAQFMRLMQQATEKQATLQTKSQIVEALRTQGDRFTAFLAAFPSEALSERVSFPAGMQPPDKSRFEMLTATKEHEMHHRGQLMLIERMLGIVPHLTREMQARMAQAQAQKA